MTAMRRQAVPDTRHSPWSDRLHLEHDGELRSVLIAALLAALVVAVADGAVLRLLATA